MHDVAIRMVMSFSKSYASFSKQKSWDSSAPLGAGKSMLYLVETKQRVAGRVLPLLGGLWQFPFRSSPVLRGRKGCIF